jgi:hypothetical protein
MISKEQLKIIEESMDLHAKHIALGFGLFLNENKYVPSEDNSSVWIKKSEDMVTSHTTSYLYFQYIKELKCKTEQLAASASSPKMEPPY